ncbi:diguanylate cyclase [Salipaludibacillus agaradhaerens]|uniref:Diguanylate cyclase n=1 Tax=Salipaludibacillus agaradhaerens TaxID=76935 RepID=A0A9Q4FZD3_SALAG|nr:diguanylate cyclase [Salipaludibacillus agaradhaerens]MCR6098670.1 diguanylate cyclase [Salipaludibacillus agaradhaerens]MCR6115677.1 diguanylate cyclase [Salipaludibacillus agaradhaerens]
MRKYQEMMYSQIRKTLNSWHSEKVVHKHEIYRFLHNVRRTADVIEMKALSEEVMALLKEIDTQSEQWWNKSEWLPIVERIERIYKPDLLIGEKSRDWSLLDRVRQKEMPFILVIDHDLKFIKGIKTFLEEEGFKVVTALSGKKGFELFYQVKPSLIILGHVLQDMNGIAFLEQMTVDAQKEMTSIVMVSSSCCEKNRVKAYDLGATDFITMPLNMNVLVPLLHNRIRYRQHIIKQIGEDELTGAFNRKYLECELSYQLTMVKHDDKNKLFSFVIVDLDRFKIVNDQFGHVKGDEVLKTFVNMFMLIKEPADTISRYGGEEFAIVMPDTTEEEALKRIEAWRDIFNEKTFMAGKTSFKVTFSAGIKEVGKKDDQIKSVIEKADKALHFAKKMGRNRSECYKETLEYVDFKDFVTIIIVDDDEIVRQVMTYHFKKRGEVAGRRVKVRTYSDGISLLEGTWYQPDKQFMILLDGRMPKMDGIEVLQKLRETYGNKNIVISMLTEKGEIDVARALNLAADDYMFKPFNANEVTVRVDRLIERVLN